MAHAASPAKPTRPPFLGFARDAKDQATLKEFAAKQYWGDACILEGDITTAAELLRTHASPQVLLVEVPSAKEAPALLDKLAEVVEPDTKVVIIGDINEYSFYVWLTEIGIFSYLLRPLKVEQLEAAWNKATEPPPSAAAPTKEPAKIIGVIGARGGAGATVFSTYLASLLAEISSRPTALIDLDPQDGSVALLLDTEPSRGVRDALEKPDRIDTLFIERVMNRIRDNLAVLSAEESLQDKVHYHEQAAETLLAALTEKYSTLVIDLSRQPTPFMRSVMKACSPVILVSDMSLLGLRDSMRVNDLFRDNLKMAPPLFIANKIGMAPKHELSISDFEKGIGAKVAAKLPFSPEVFMEITPDFAALKKNTPAVKALRDFAVSLLPAAEEEEEAEGKKRFSFLGKDKAKKG